VYTTRAQQQAVIELADGTRMTLAPQTTLRLQHFGAQSRAIVLETGEAYFEVAHASGTPFTVRSGMATTQVLGTAFLVRYKAGESHAHVSVIDGKVRIVARAATSAHANGGLTLTAGQAGSVSDSSIQMSAADDLAPSTEWQSGHVVFHHTSVATVLQALSRWYGYHFRYVDQAFGAQSVTMRVSTRSSAQALATIEQLLAVNLTVVGDTVTLVPQAPRASQSMPRVRTYDVWTPTKEVGR
jgi:transmembrane sensor